MPALTRGTEVDGRGLLQRGDRGGIDHIFGDSQSSLIEYLSKTGCSRTDRGGNQGRRTQHIMKNQDRSRWLFPQGDGLPRQEKF